MGGYAGFVQSAWGHFGVDRSSLQKEFRLLPTRLLPALRRALELCAEYGGQHVSQFDVRLQFIVAAVLHAQTLSSEVRGCNERLAGCGGTFYGGSCPWGQRSCRLWTNPDSNPEP